MVPHTYGVFPSMERVLVFNIICDHNPSGMEAFIGVLSPLFPL